MSRVQKSVTMEDQSATNEEMPATDLSELSGDNQSGETTHARRIVVQANVTAEDLEAGYTVSIPGAGDIFKPNYDMDKLSDTQRENLSKLDFSKGIVTGMTLKSVYSDVGEAVSVGINFRTSVKKSLDHVHVAIPYGYM